MNETKQAEAISNLTKKELDKKIAEKNEKLIYQCLDISISQGIIKTNSLFFGDVMIKLADIAADLGLSVSVVSRALSAKPDKHTVIRKETVDKIREYARQVGYKPNRQASFMRKGKCATIFCFLPDTPTRITNDLMFGIAETACAEGFPIKFFLGHSAVDFDRFLLHSKENAHSGLLTLPPSKMSAEVFKSFCEYHRNGGKIIFLNTISNSNNAISKDFQDVPSLNIDDYFGGQLAAEHLICLGCEVFYLVSLSPSIIYRTRENGFLDTCIGQGISAERITPENLKKVNLSDGRKYGIFTDSDYLALDLYPILARKGIIPGKEVFLCGFDDIFYSRIAHPSLTTIHQPSRQEGRLAVHKLVNMIYGEDGQNELVKPFLVYRESTGGQRPDPEYPENESRFTELKMIKQKSEE